MSGKRTKPDDPLIERAREMRARGKSYAIIGRVCGRSLTWAQFWTNDHIRQKKNEYSADRHKAKRQ